MLLQLAKIAIEKSSGFTKGEDEVRVRVRVRVRVSVSIREKG